MYQTWYLYCSLSKNETRLGIGIVQFQKTRPDSVSINFKKWDLTRYRSTSKCETSLGIITIKIMVSEYPVPVMTNRSNYYAALRHFYYIFRLLRYSFMYYNVYLFIKNYFYYLKIPSFQLDISLDIFHISKC